MLPAAVTYEKKKQTYMWKLDETFVKVTALYCLQLSSPSFDHSSILLFQIDKMSSLYTYALYRVRLSSVELWF